MYDNVLSLNANIPDNNKYDDWFVSDKPPFRCIRLFSLFRHIHPVACLFTRTTWNQQIQLASKFQNVKSRNIFFSVLMPFIGINCYTGSGLTCWRSVINLIMPSLVLHKIHVMFILQETEASATKDTATSTPAQRPASVSGQLSSRSVWLWNLGNYL